MEALELLPIASMTLLGAATAVRCRLFGQRWRQRRQQDGVQWCGALQNLVMHLQRHRGLSSMWLNGDRSVGPRLHAEREQANQHMHTLAQLPDGHLSAADVLPRAQWERFCADWRALCAELEQLDAADSIARHTELISQALNWLRAIGEASLSAGPQDHGWVSALVDQLPALSEALGQARAISAGVAARDQCTAVARVRLAYLASRIETLNGACRQALAASQHSRLPGMRDGLARIDAGVQRTLQCLASQLTGCAGANGADCFGVCTEAIDAVFALMSGLLAGARSAQPGALPLAA